MQQYVPMRLASFPEPFDHPDWLYELKLDGFRCLAYIEPSGCTLVSRNGHVYKSFGDLSACLAEELLGRSAILDGEIVHLDDQGRPQFYELLRRRRPVHFYAFDLLAVDGQDLRARPLIERKLALRQLIHTDCRSLLYVDHFDGHCTDVFRLVCESDLEGIVAKWKRGRYVCGDEQPPDRRLSVNAFDLARAQLFTWLKIKNPGYSQMEGRGELFEKRAVGSR